MKRLRVKHGAIRRFSCDMEEIVKLGMEETVKFDMEKEVWSKFPEELFMNVMVYLPLPTLLRFCTVSKKWNSITKDPKFHEMRETFCHEFIAEVLDRRKAYVLSCTKGFLLVISDTYEFYVMRPSQAYLRQIPRPEWSYQYENFLLLVVDIVVDEVTKEYMVIASSSSTLMSSPLATGPADMRGRAPWEVDKWRHLHHFNSVSGVWSWCGNGGMNLCDLSPVVGAVMHRSCVLLLVQSCLHYRIQRYKGSCSWEALPGNCPYSGPQRPLLFDHNGKLRLAVASSSGCNLWEYDDDCLSWTLRHLLPNTGFYHMGMDRQYVDSVTYDYCAVAGDGLFFGKVSDAVETSLCRRMRYNFITRVLERMSPDERERVEVKGRTRGRIILYEPA